MAGTEGDRNGPAVPLERDSTARWIGEWQIPEHGHSSIAQHREALALAGAISALASQAEHGNATGAGGHGKNEVEEIAERSRGENRLKAGKQC